MTPPIEVAATVALQLAADAMSAEREQRWPAVSEDMQIKIVRAMAGGEPVSRLLHEHKLHEAQLYAYRERWLGEAALS